jgi:hypothetical protein
MQRLEFEKENKIQDHYIDIEYNMSSLLMFNYRDKNHFSERLPHHQWCNIILRAFSSTLLLSPPPPPSLSPSLPSLPMQNVATRGALGSFNSYIVEHFPDIYIYKDVILDLLYLKFMDQHHKQRQGYNTVYCTGAVHVF